MSMSISLVSMPAAVALVTGRPALKKSTKSSSSAAAASTVIIGVRILGRLRAEGGAADTIGLEATEGEKPGWLEAGEQGVAG
jgi:hypothetical protein